jgi:Lipocalin-like domain
MKRISAFTAGMLAGLVSMAVLGGGLVPVLGAVVLSQTRPQQVPPVYGVWQVVEQTIDGRTVSGVNLGLGFHVYTPKYFAVVRESGTPPRAVVDNAETATAAQLLAAWGPLVAQVGTYEISGDQVTERVLVAKDAAYMQPGGTAVVRRYRLEGNTLTIEPSRDGGGRNVTLKLLRVE